MRFLSTAGLARMSSRHPWRVLGAWLVVLVFAFVAMSGLSDALTTSSNFTGKPESEVGADLVRDHLRGDRPASETVIVQADGATIDDAAFQAVVEQTAAAIRAPTR